MIKPINEGQTTYWINAEPSEGVRNFKTLTGKEMFWLEGLPEENLFTMNNSDTGRFFLLFE